mgnify:CR=1 FL=1
MRLQANEKCGKSINCIVERETYELLGKPKGKRLYRNLLKD